MSEAERIDLVDRAPLTEKQQNVYESIMQYQRVNGYAPTIREICKMVVPLSSKLKDIPVHVILNPKDVSGFGLSKISDFMPEDAQTISKGCIRAKSGTIIEDSGVREEIDRALIRQFDLLPVARKMVMEELANGQQN